MGTNYYLRTNEPCTEEHKIDPAETNWCCYNTGNKLLHIGKSSYGWTFSWHAIPEEKLTTSDEWYERLKDGEIWNEYGERVTYEYFKDLVESKEASDLNHTTYCREAQDLSTQNHGYKDCYLDPKGHSFTISDFS